jgi:hypothetical protein
MKPNITEKQKSLLRELGKRPKENDSDFEEMVREKIATLSYQMVEARNKLTELSELLAQSEKNLVGFIKSFESYAQMYEVYRKEIDGPLPEPEVDEPEEVEGEPLSDSEKNPETD